MTAEPRRGQRIAAGHVLGLVLIGLFIAMWLGGVARFAVPVLLFAIGGWFLARFLKRVREPLP